MAGSFNKVILMGNLVKDPELRYTPQGTAVTDITLAINDPRARGAQGGNAQDRNQTATFVDVTVWERSAEVICEYMRKGRPLLIEGRLAMDSWDDKETGKKMRKLKVIATGFQFVDSGRDGGEGEGGFSGGSSGGYSGGVRGGREGGQGGQGGGYNRPQQSRPAQQRPQQDDDFGGFPSDNAGDDIPF